VNIWHQRIVHLNYQDLKRILDPSNKHIMDPPDRRHVTDPTGEWRWTYPWDERVTDLPDERHLMDSSGARHESPGQAYDRLPGRARTTDSSEKPRTAGVTPGLCQACITYKGIPN